MVTTGFSPTLLASAPARLRLLVHGRDHVTVDRERDHHHVPTLTVGGSQAHHRPDGKPRPRFVLGKPHAEDIRASPPLARPDPNPAFR